MDWHNRFPFSVGEGGRSLGMSMKSDIIHERVPRNSPALFNLGAKEFKTFFHDGRVHENPYAEPDFIFLQGPICPRVLTMPSRCRPCFLSHRPPKWQVNMMVTDVSENDIASRAAAGLPGIWSLLAERLQGVD